MTAVMSEFVKYLKRLLREKGQGIVEFALLCAFCAALGLFIRDVGFSEAFNESLENSKDDLYWAEIKQRTTNSYLSYFKKWKGLSAEQLNDDNTKQKRLEADQKALVIIAEAFLGKTDNQALNLMEFFTNATKDTPNGYVDAVKCLSDDGTGFSDILVPLSYSKNTLQGDTVPASSTSGWLWLDANNNQNTVTFLTDGNGKVYDKFDTTSPTYSADLKDLKTITTDRLFYSDKMLTSNYGRVTLRLHYTKGKVDSVEIALRTSKSNTGTLADDKLCLHVTEAGHDVVQKKSGISDSVVSPGDYYNDDGTPK